MTKKQQQAVPSVDTLKELLAVEVSFVALLTSAPDFFFESCADFVVLTDGLIAHCRMNTDIMP